MSRASVVARARAFAAGGFEDTCIVERQTASTTNPDTGVVTPTWTQVYSGPCRVQERGGYPRDINTAPDQPQLAVAREVQFPVATSTAVLPDDRLTMVTAAYDPALVGVKAWLRAKPAKTHATSRRFHMEEITG